MTILYWIYLIGIWLILSDIANIIAEEAGVALFSIPRPGTITGDDKRELIN
jgi:hypothetical protein